MKHVSQTVMGVVDHLNLTVDQIAQVMRNIVLYEGGDTLITNHLRMLRHHGMTIPQHMVVDTVLPILERAETFQRRYGYMYNIQQRLSMFMEGIHDGGYVKITKAHEAPARDYCYVGAARYRATTVLINPMNVTPGYRSGELKRQTLQDIQNMSNVVLYWLNTHGALRETLDFLYTVLEDVPTTSNSDGYRVLGSSIILHSHVLHTVHTLSIDPQYAHIQDESIPWEWRAPMVAQEMAALLCSNGDDIRAQYRDFMEYYYPKVEKKRQETKI